MTPAIRIARIEPDQLGSLLTLCREHAAYERAEFEDDGQPERWRAALFSPAPALHCWLAIDQERPCGFMSVTVDFATWSAVRYAYMDCLYLREPYRGLGIGRAFIATLRAFCEEHALASAQWQTPPDNDLGTRFYDRLGASARPKVRYAYDVSPEAVP